MFEVLVYKHNNDELKKFLIPKNKGYNCSSWILITIKTDKAFLMERFLEKPEIDNQEWELKTNYAYPAALLNEFLRLDFNDKNFNTYL